MAIGILFIYLIGYCAGFGFGLDLTSNDLDTIVSDQDTLVQSLEAERNDSVETMAVVCEALMKVNDRICEERVNDAFLMGMSVVIDSLEDE